MSTLEAKEFICEHTEIPLSVMYVPALPMRFCGKSWFTLGYSVDPTYFLVFL